MVIVEMGLKKLPLLPTRHTMHLMAKAAVTVYEAGVEKSNQCRPLTDLTTRSHLYYNENVQGSFHSLEVEAMASTGGKQHFIRSVIEKHPELKDQTGKFALPVLNDEAKKQKMGFEITAADFGNFRTELKKGGGKTEPATTEASVPANKKPAAPAAKKAAPAAAASDPVAAAKAVKALVSQFGAETVKGLADLFSK